jgi:hypothetical protein
MSKADIEVHWYAGDKTFPTPILYICGFELREIRRKNVNRVE